MHILHDDYVLKIGVATSSDLRKSDASFKQTGSESGQEKQGGEALAITTTAAPPTVCTDRSGWKDSDGDTCETIVANGHCDAAADFAVDGVDAKAACCGCGGGATGSESGQEQQGGE